MAYEKIQKKLSLIRKKTSINNNKEMYDAVKNILDKEKRKKFKKDLELIDECIETLIMLRGYDINKIEAETEIYKEKTLNIIKNETSNNKSRNLFKKKYVLVTVTILLLMIFSQLTAMAFGFNPILEMYNFFTSNTDISTVTEGDITYSYLDNTKTYSSIEELIAQENLDIIYPIELPDGIKLRQIRKYDLDGDNQFYYSFSNDDLIWQINERHIFDVNDNEYNTLEIGTIEIKIIKQDINYTAIFYYNNFEYGITYTIYDSLIEIISNLNLHEGELN